MEHFAPFEKKISITFKDRELLKNAFIHRSYLNEHKAFHLPSNEKLEFLGDSVLSLITSMYLYNNYPALKEGDYTEIKSAIVKTGSLAQAGASLELGTYLYLSKGEETGHGRTNPNILADCFEALIAAVFIDQGFDVAYSFVDSHLFKGRLDKLISENTYASAKSTLQERVQSIHKTVPVYTVDSLDGPEHERIFTVSVSVVGEKYGTGRGNTKKVAEEEAAQVALEKLVKDGYN
jgi:ribonuclease III